MNSRLLHRTAVLATALALVPGAFSQADRGTLTGTVTDPHGALMPNVQISIRHPETGAQHETVSTTTGHYSVPQLPAGTYDLSVAAPGFKKFTQQGINVAVAQTVRIDVVMEVGSSTESITVSADASLLKTESAEQSYNIETERMNALPLNFGARGPGSFRNPFTFVALIPGGNITDRNNIRVNGMPNVTFAIRLEGRDQSRPLDPNNSDMVAPSVEAVQEISVQTSNFQAEYRSRRPGGSGKHHLRSDLDHHDQRHRGAQRFPGQHHSEGALRSRGRQNPELFPVTQPCRTAEQLAADCHDGSQERSGERQDRSQPHRQGEAQLLLPKLPG